MMRSGLAVQLPHGTELFVNGAAGFASLGEVELGGRARWGSALQASVSSFHATSPSEITFGDGAAISEFLRGTQRDGVRFAARYEPRSWLVFDLEVSGLRARFRDGTPIPGATQRIASAGTSLRTSGGWTASLLVNALGRRDSLADDSLPVRTSTFVNARLSRNLDKRTRLSLDVFNIFDHHVANLDYFATSRLWDQPGAGDSFLFNPAEPRGFRVKLKTAF